jgi:hypothetical protein
MAISSRALKLFNQSIRNPNTEIYHGCLDKFLEWAHKDYESLQIVVLEIGHRNSSYSELARVLGKGK